MIIKFLKKGGFKNEKSVSHLINEDTDKRTLEMLQQWKSLSHEDKMWLSEQIANDEEAAQVPLLLPSNYKNEIIQSAKDKLSKYNLGGNKKK